MSKALAVVTPIGEIERMADAIVTSKLFGVQNKAQAVSLMLLAEAEGLHPMTAARDYHIIQGKPSLTTDAMLSRYLNSGGKVEWIDYTDKRVVAKFTHPAGGTVTIDWDMQRAQAAGLGGKDMWRKYPRQMLRSRVVSEGVRATNPGVQQGMYTPEEVVDFDDNVAVSTDEDGRIDDVYDVKPEAIPDSEVVVDAVVETPKPPPAWWEIWCIGQFETYTIVQIRPWPKVDGEVYELTLTYNGVVGIVAYRPSNEETQARARTQFSAEAAPVTLTGKVTTLDGFNYGKIQSVKFGGSDAKDSEAKGTAQDVPSTAQDAETEEVE